MLHGKSSAPNYRLALVNHDQPSGTDQIRYVLDPFAKTSMDSYSATALVLRWDREWARGVGPL